MHHISFGNVLKEARLAKGLDIATVSRQLRIRQDIILAIENNDFSRMPPRGYTRNMITAYARLVGLNPSDVSRLYLDQEYAFQVNRAHSSMNANLEVKRSSVSSNRSSGRTGDASSSTRSFSRVGASGNRSGGSHPDYRAGATYDNEGATNSLGRRMYSSQPRTGHMPRTQHAPAAQSPVLHTARRSAVDGGGNYGNMVAQPTSFDQPKNTDPRLKFIIIGIVAIALIVFGVLFFTSHSNQQTTNIPVTGAESKATTETDETATKKTTEKAPTSFDLKYVVDDGASVYIEVYVDDAAKEASTVEGPAEQTYTCSSNLRFVCVGTEGITLYLNDDPVELTANSNGIVKLEYSFEEILNQWYADHPDVERTSTDDTAAATSDESAASEESGTTASGSTSSASSNS